MASRFHQFYQTNVVPALQKTLHVSNAHAVPKIEKVTVNIGLGQMIRENQATEVAKESLRQITGQQPVETKARKSISNFKIRKGQTVGYKVTLRGERMYEFLDRLINVTLPRVRDFSGISKSGVDASGHLSIGFKEQHVFPEIDAGGLQKIHGLQVIVTTTSRTREDGMALFEAMGFPFKKS
jgi:large subunit ribosomal protein L5